MSFAAAAQAWPNKRLQERLLKAVRNAKAPIFLIQAANYYSIEPSNVFGPVIQANDLRNRVRIYPPFGNSNQEGRGHFSTREAGIEVWGHNVLSFINSVWLDK